MFAFIKHGFTQSPATHLPGIKSAANAKGFDWLGFHCCPTDSTVSEAALSRRDKKLARLYETGASKKRIALYLALWLGWAGGVGAEVVEGHVQCFTNTHDTYIMEKMRGQEAWKRRVEVRDVVERLRGLGARCTITEFEFEPSMLAGKCDMPDRASGWDLIVLEKFMVFGHCTDMDELRRKY